MLKLLFYDLEIPILLKNVGNPFGGACVRQYAIAQGFIDNNCQVGILTWKGANEYVGQNTNRMDLIESFPRDKGIRVLRTIYPRLLLLYKAVNTYAPDYLFQKGASIKTFLLGIVAKLSGTHFVYMATSNKDGDNRLSTVRNQLTRTLYFMGLKMTSAIVCQNSYQQETFMKKFPNKKVILMRNPYYSDYEIEPPITLAERKYFAWIGNYRAVKNLPAVYEIVRSLPEYQFKIAGTFTVPKDFTRETKQALEELKRCQNVELVGHLRREEILPFLSNAYALFNTSFIEGFSNTFLESFAAGTPVVTRKEIDADGIITENNLGKTIDSYEEMPDALRFIATHESFDQISLRCQEYLKKHHNPKNITSSLLKDLQGLLEQQ